jgi:hypothetical protein
MKIFKRLCRPLALSAVLSLSALCLSALLLSGCIIVNDVNTKLDGIWTSSSGSFDIKFNGGSAVFTRITPGSGWDTVRTKGLIRVGDQKLRYISGGNRRWTGQSLYYTNGQWTIYGWLNCTITMDEDGRTIEVYSSYSGGDLYSYFTRK